ADSRIGVRQPVLPRLGEARKVSKRIIKQVKRAADFLGNRFKAARADQLDLRVEVTLDANLPFQQLRSGSHFEWLNLFDFGRMKVDAARRIGLMDAEFADS